jgi:hypothetical protein
VVPGHSKGDVTGRGKQAFTVGRESGVEAKGTAASTSGLIVLVMLLRDISPIQCYLGEMTHSPWWDIERNSHILTSVLISRAH